MSDDLRETLNSAVEAAINGAVSDHERGFVTRWLALVESVDEDGNRGVWTLAAHDMQAWETLGLLAFAQELELKSLGAE